jgi:hypothetical protein
MAVPDTNSFSLSDVRTELGLGSTTSLVACIAAAVASSYDPAYYTAPATSLLEFRNYGAACNTTTSLNFYPSSGNASSTTACSAGGGETGYYYLGTGANVENGGTVYTDAGGCNTFNGGNLYYRVRANSGTPFFFVIKINTVGVVSAKTACP